MPFPQALIILAPIVKKAVDNYLSSEIPEQVNRRIQIRVQELVLSRIQDLMVGLHHTRNIYVNLAILSLILTVVQYYIQQVFLENLIFLALYGIPLFMSARSLRNLYLTFQNVLKLEGNLKNEITKSLEEADLPKKLLFNFYEKRSIDDLAKFTAGTIIFELIKKVSENRKIIMISVLSYFVSFFNLFLIRYFL